MTVCALINLSTMLVQNMIVAVEADPVPDGLLLKDITNGPDFVTIGTPWDGENFVPPPEPTPYAPNSKMRML